MEMKWASASVAILVVGIASLTNSALAIPTGNIVPGSFEKVSEREGEILHCRCRHLVTHTQNTILMEKRLSLYPLACKSSSKLE